MINENIFTRGVVLLFSAYLTLFFISVHLYYENDGRFRDGLFGLLYTRWGLWFYALYFLPIIISVFAIIKQYRHRIPLEASSFSVMLALIIAAHVIYWSISTSFKYYVYHYKTINSNIIETQLQEVEISRPNILYESNPIEKNSSYRINIKVINPLLYDVEIQLSSVNKNKNFNLLKIDAKSGETKSFSVNVGAERMTEVLDFYDGFWVNYTLTEHASYPKINSLIDFSHELCKWAILTCPDLDGIKHNNSTYPFDDDKLYRFVGSHSRRGVLAEYTRAEIEVH